MTISYDAIVSRLLDANPSFRDLRCEIYSDLPYDVAGTFANYLVEQIERGASTNDGNIVKAFEFIEELASSEDELVQELAATGILEVLADSEAVRHVARQLLGPKGLAMFERMRGAPDRG